MTEEQAKTLHRMFSSDAGNKNGCCEKRIWMYIASPCMITDLTRLKSNDQDVSRRIAELESLIEDLKVVRLAYAERCSQLCSTPSYPVVQLKRKKEWHGNVHYYLSTFRRYENGQETERDTKTFPGSERAAAIQEYKTYVKNHPGIIAEMDIQKGKWER